MRGNWLAGALPPRRTGARCYTVVWPRGTTPLRVTLLGATLWGCYTHQVLTNEATGEVKTKPCMGEGHCPYDHVQIGCRWYAFGAAQLMAGKQRVVLMASLRAVEQIEVLSRNLDTLRGLSLELTAQKGPGRAHHVARIDRSLGGALPEEHELGPSLCQLWDVTHLPGDVRPYGAVDEMEVPS